MDRLSMDDHVSTGENHYRRRRILHLALQKAGLKIPLSRECAREANSLTGFTEL